MTASVLNALMAETRETASLFVMTELSRVCVFRVEGPQQVRHHLKIGDRSPLWNGATGLVLLSDKANSVVERVLATAPVGFDESAFRIAVRSTRESHVASSHGTREIGLSAVAVPVLDTTSEVVAALSVSGPTDRFTGANFKVFIRAATLAAEELSKQLVGYPLFGSSSGPYP
jgi:DNA-binding IclR family transcriptional regulator